MTHWTWLGLAVVLVGCTGDDSSDGSGDQTADQSSDAADASDDDAPVEGCGALIGSCRNPTGNACFDFYEGWPHDAQRDACNDGDDTEWSDLPCDTSEYSGGCIKDQMPFGCQTTWYPTTITAADVMSQCTASQSEYVPAS
jgi:hypothetical protein